MFLRKLRLLAAWHRNEAAKSGLFRFASMSIDCGHAAQPPAEGMSIKRRKQRGYLSLLPTSARLLIPRASLVGCFPNFSKYERHEKTAAGCAASGDVSIHAPVPRVGYRESG